MLMAEAKGLVMLAVVNLILYAGFVGASNHALKAIFNMNGIKGEVVFSQPQGNNPISILVNLTGINETLAWKIQQLPMIYDGNAALSCNANAVGAVFDPKMAMKSGDYNTKCSVSSGTRFESCAVGDLTGMFGNLDANKAQLTFTNTSLMIPTTGPYSIMGRTLVLYSGDTPKACALITPTQSMKTAVAVFKYPVAGFVYLRQVDENSDTSVFVDLFFVNDSQSNSQFTWQINQGVGRDDASDPSYCKVVGEMFNPNNINNDNCNQTRHDNCAIGDLTSKHGNIDVSVATKMQSATKMAFTDTNLPLSGANLVIGESIVLFSDPKKPVACAKIVLLEPKTLKATFEAKIHQGVSGYFKFTQSSPFDPATTEINLSALKNMAQGYHVHAYPSPSYMHLTPIQSCESLIAGDHWNPFNINLKTSPAAGTGTVDEYEIGDMSGKYGSFLNHTAYNKQHTDYNLPLFGRNSIQGRSIVIHKLKKDGNKRWVCTNIVPEEDPTTTYAMQASVNFAGPNLLGVILIDQHLSSKPNTAGIATTIFINIKYSDSSTQTSSHMWDVHDKPVGGDASADGNKRCMSLQETFNPYKVNLKEKYSACSPTNMLRCASGDLSGKHTPFKVGGGRMLFNDVNLPLFGRNSVVGRGIAVYVKDGGKDRLGCANIVADSSMFTEKSLEFVMKEVEFSSDHFVDVMSKALEIPKWRLFNIHTEKAKVDECLKVKFGIIGKVDQVSQPVKKFDDILKNNPGTLKPYQPSEKCDPQARNGERGHHVNFFLLITVVMATSVMEGLRLI